MIEHPLSVQGLLRLWNDFFHAQESPLPLAMFRICFGGALFVESLGLLRWGSDLFGRPGIQNGAGRSIGQSDRMTPWIFRIHTFSCLGVVVGLMTRVSAASVFLNFCFRMRRNWLVGQGGDNVAKYMAFLLIFSNAGGVLSVDHLLHWHWLGGTSEPASQWPMRLVQIQVSIIYLRTVFWKLRAKEWLEGTAVFYSLYRNVNLRGTRLVQGAASWLAYAPLAAMLTWFTLVAEVFIGVFVWFQETRNVALAVAVVTHLSYETFLAIKQFQWLMLASLLVFLTPHDWTSLRDAIQAAWR